METIEIKGSVYQAKIDAFKEALNHLKEAKSIILANNPTPKEHHELPEFSKAIYYAEDECTSAVCSLSTVIGILVSDDIANSIL